MNIHICLYISRIPVSSYIYISIFMTYNLLIIKFKNLRAPWEK